MSQASVISSHGLQNAQAIVNASAKTGVPLFILCAFTEHESGGANVFGHDRGGAYSGGGTVTLAKYNDFLRMVRAGHTSNGVGPLQITYPGYFKPQTAEVAGLWIPENNLVFGAKIIKGYLGGNYSEANLNRAGQIYNSGSANGAPSYGSLTVTLCRKWKSILGGGAGTGGGSTAPSSGHADTGQDLNQWMSTGRVKQLQEDTLGFKGKAVDGVAGPDTVNALIEKAGYKREAHPTLDPKGSNTIKKMQVTLIVSEATKATHLVVDGILGKETAAQIDKYMKGGGRFVNLAKMDTKAPAKKPTPKPATLPTLKKGSTGGSVKVVQEFFLKMFPAYAGPIKSSGGADGKFGNGTVAVVKEFQKRSKLSADGVIGKDTWAALKKEGLKI